MNKSKLLIGILVMVFLASFSAISFADNIQPYASDTISAYTMGFSSNKTISLYCVTYSSCTISAKIEVYESNTSTGKWDLVKTDTVTVYKATTLSTDKTYSEVKDGGTYKVSVTYSAGGDSRTVSAKRSF